MYQVFGNIIKNPILGLGMLLLAIILFYNATAMVSGLGTLLGFETKENISKKLSDTENELDKAIDVIEKNKDADSKKEEISEITQDKVIKDLEEILDIKDKENTNLKELDSIEPTTTLEVSDSQRKVFILILDRNDSFKGAKR